MAYVDLNPVGACIVGTPECSAYTSVRARIEGDYRASTLRGAVARLTKRRGIGHFRALVRPLMAFADQSVSSAQPTLPMKQREYLKLVDQTGRIAVHGKRGRIDPALESILERIGLSADDWIQCSTAFRQNCRRGELRIAESG